MRRAVGPVLAVALLTAACTGVPTTSSPQTVQAINTGVPSDLPSSGPPPGADPDTVVDGFLAANATDDGRHAAARQYLTPAARTRWSDTSATIISDESGPTYDSATRTVTVYGRLVGSLNQDGIYTPSLQSDGSGGPREPYKFTLTQVGGEYRIDQLPGNGLLLTEDQFREFYQQYVLYFYDNAEQYLVPDPRWSALTDRVQLMTWLLDELAGNPSTPLEHAVSTDTFPAQADQHNITVTMGTSIKLEIPGSSQLDANGRDHLAIQICQTLLPALLPSQGTFEITDGGNPVSIPRANGITFTSADFPPTTEPPVPDPFVYYLLNGRVETQTGKPIAGPFGSGRVFLTSVAVHRDTTGKLVVAGVEGSGRTARLVFGSDSGEVYSTSVRGPLSRPAFAPGRDEVWIASGPQLYRVAIQGTSSQVSPVQIPSAPGGGRITALRLSPDGSRIALVIAGATAGTAQLYVGSIVRGSGQVRVDTLTPVSPEGIEVTDVGWLEAVRLFAIGNLVGSNEGRTFSSGVDGSEWTNNTIGNLPGAPVSVTAAAGVNVWVSASNLVWEQSSPTQWISPVSRGQTPGYAPIYLE